MVMSDILLLCLCFPLMLVLMAAKFLIAFSLVEMIVGAPMTYSIYKDDVLKFSTTDKKEADSFHSFLVERYGKLAVRFETIKV